MASLVKRGSTYYVAWRENGRQRRKSLETSNLREAKTLRDAFERRLRDSQWRPNEKNPTPEEFMARFKPWAAHYHKPKTQETELLIWKAFIEWRRPKRLGDVSKQDIIAYAQYLLDEGKSKATVNNHLVTIKALYGHAIKTFSMFDGENPVQGVKLLKSEQSQPPYLTVEQIEALLDAAKRHSNEMFVYCVLGLGFGLRKAELASCKWDYFDWNAKLLHIPSDKVHSTKSHKGRSIPINDHVAKLLEPHAKDSGYIFSPGRTSKGKGYYRFDPRTSFENVCESAGLKGVTIHWLRHTFATQCARDGVSIYLISDWLGHSSVTITMRYAHVQGYNPEINRNRMFNSYEKGGE